MNPSRTKTTGSGTQRLPLSLEPLEPRILLQADWTFMVYMAADNNLEDAAIDDFLEMAHVGTDANVNIVVQMDRTDWYDTSYGNWTDTRRGVVNEDDVPDLTWGTSIGEANMGATGTLQAFVTWAIQNYEADRYALVLWDHGAGWPELCVDYTNFDSLTPDEVDQALYGALFTTGVDSMDLVAFDACLMGMLEVAYEISDRADIMVASEDVVPWDGMPYDLILGDLAAHPTMAAAELGLVMAQRYGNAYVAYGFSIGVVDLAQVPSLAMAVSDFGTTVMLDGTGADHALVGMHQESTPHFGYMDYCDLGIFMQGVADDPLISPGSGISAGAEAVLAEYDEAIIAFYGSPEGGSGLSLYFPARGGYVDPSYITDLDMSVDAYWDEFLVWWVGADASWTFMIYMCADNNLEGYALEDFLELASVGSSDDVKFVVLMDRAFEGDGDYYVSSYGDWTDARRGLVEFGDEPWGDGLAPEQIIEGAETWGESIGEVDMADPATLSAFVIWAMAAYPAANYSLIMWDHGSGCDGLMYDEDDAGGLNSYPSSVAIGDFNGDGASDFAAASYLEDTVTVFLGDGAGGFVPAETVPVGIGPYAMVAGDFNADGLDDLAVANALDGTVTVLLAQMTEVPIGPYETVLELTFLDATYVVSTFGALGITAGDFDGDGTLDLAVADNSGGAVSILLGVGDGTFGAATGYSVGAYPVAVAAGDFDADGDLDIATANEGSNSVSIMEGAGDGTFSLFGFVGVGTSPWDVVAADLDDDGAVDLVVANWVDDDVSVLLSNADLTFVRTDYGVGDEPTAIGVADFDADGVLDLAVANEGDDTVTVLLGNGDATFQPGVAYSVGLTPVDVAAGDLSGDGWADLVTADWDGDSVTILFNNGVGTFAAPDDYGVGDRPRDVASADLNADGELDLAVANSGDDDVTVLFGNGDGTFGGAADYAVGDQPVAVAAADYDADGDTDLAVANWLDDTVSVLWNNGTGVFSAGPVLTVGTNPADVFAVDVDSDGDPDLAVANTATDNVSVLINTGGSFAAAASYPAGDGPASLGAGDFDGDGYADLAVANAQDDTVSILLNNGDGTFAAPVDYGVGGGPAGLAVGDLDGDTVLDIVTANAISADVSVLLGVGDGTFGASAEFAVVVGAAPVGVVLADADGDSNPDVVTANRNGDDVGVLLNVGGGSLGPARTFEAGNGPVAVAAGDFNVDGVIDLAVPNMHDDNVSVLMGNTPGTFGESASYRMAGSYAFGAIMSVMDLREALEAVDHIDVLRIEACLMATVEVAYEVRNEATLFVASENFEVGSSPYGVLTAYDVVAATMVGNPTADALSVADLLANTYYMAYPTGSYNSTASVVDLAEVGDLALAFDAFVDEFMASGKLGDRVALDGHRAAAWFPAIDVPWMWPEALPDTRDLGAILAGVAADDGMTPSITAAAAAVLAAYEDAVLINYADPQGATGLTLYFPEAREFVSPDYTWENLTFLDDTSYSEFLDWLFATVQPFYAVTNGTATVSFYDTYGVAEIRPEDAPDLFSVSFDGGVVTSVSIGRYATIDGLGIVISGATSVGSIRDGRRMGSDVAFIASDAPVGSIWLRAGISGENLNGRQLGGINFAGDIDGDGWIDDYTGLYCTGGVGSVGLRGDLHSDAFIDGDLGSYWSGRGGIFSFYGYAFPDDVNFLVTGDVESMRLAGLSATLRVGGSLELLSMRRGSLWSDSTVDVGGTLGSLRALSMDMGANIRAGERIGSLRLSAGVPGYLDLTEDGEPVLGTGWAYNMANVLAPQVDSVSISGDVYGLRLLAGADLGDDFQLGGTGADADVYGVGHIGTVRVRGFVYNSLIAAGVSQAGWLIGGVPGPAGEAPPELDPDIWDGRYIGSGFNLVWLRNDYLFVDGSTIGDVTIMRGTAAYLPQGQQYVDWFGDPSSLGGESPKPPLYAHFGIASYEILGTVTMSGFTGPRAGPVQIVTTVEFSGEDAGYYPRHPYIFVEIPRPPTDPSYAF
jgi:hypothetical protein